MEWGYFIVGMVSYQIGRLIVLVVKAEMIQWKLLKNRIRDAREREVLVVARIQFPDATTITISSVDTSDKKAFEDLERQLLSAKPK